MIKVKFRPKNKELEKGEPVCSLHSLGNQEQGETGFGWLSLIPIVIPIVRSALRMGGVLSYWAWCTLQHPLVVECTNGKLRLIE